MKDKKVYKIIITAILSALCFVGTMVQIPLPSGGMIHLGNFICILGALLCGGLVGGLAGGIGCGLFDLIIYSSVEGMVRYFIIKFAMGFLVGFLFRFIINKKKKINYFAGLLSMGVLIIAAVSIAWLGYANEYITIKYDNPGLYIGIVVSIGYVFGVLLILASIFSTRIKKIQKVVLFVCSISVLFNIVLEFIAKLLSGIWITGLNIEGAAIKSFSSMPSCILTGCVTVIAISIIYPRLYTATKKINWLNDLDEEEMSNEA